MGYFAPDDAENPLGNCCLEQLVGPPFFKGVAYYFQVNMVVMLWFSFILGSMKFVFSFDFVYGNV